jgi:hypothetical protein
MFGADLQHAIIDFLPLYDQALELILAKPDVPIIAGSYTKFFKDMFPFNTSRFISRNIAWRRDEVNKHSRKFTYDNH